MASVTIMVVDTIPERGTSLAASLDLNEGVEVVSVASARDTALKQLQKSPDVVVLSSGALGQNTTFSFIRALEARSPSSRVLIMFETVPSDEVLVGSIKSGVRGYVRAGDPPAIIAKAARAVSRGEMWAERRILVKAISQPMLLPETLHSHVPTLSPLTGREREMLALLVQGATNREIAENSNISERTVKTHLYRIYKKLNVKSRAKVMALLSHS